MPRCFLPSLVIFVLLTGVACGEDWPCWRGPTRQGISLEKGLPVTWSATKNIAWKTPISGSGWSSPIVCHDRVFVTATTPDGASCRVISLDRRSGKIVWDKEVFQQKPGNKREENSYATPTPVTDGELLFAWKEHLRGTFWPSLFAADGKIYATSNQGETTVFEAGPHYKLIAHNARGETCMASIAASDGHLFIRSAENLYCIGRP